MWVIVKKEEEIIGDRIKVAHNFYRRLKGLLGKKTLKRGEGLLLVPCRQIHTFLMSFSVDVLFLNKQGEVVALFPGLSPGRKSPLIKESYQVLELPAGTIALQNLKKGDCLEIINLKEKV